MTDARQRTAVELVAFIICFFLVWFVRATFLYCIDEAISSDTLRIFYSSLVKFVLWVMSAILFVRWVRRTSPYRYLGLSVPPSKKQWPACMGILGIFLGIIIAVALVAEGKSFSFARIAGIFTLS